MLLEGVSHIQEVTPRVTRTGSEWEGGEVSTYRRGHPKEKDKAKVAMPDETRGRPIVPKTRKTRCYEYRTCKTTLSQANQLLPKRIPRVMSERARYL